MYSNEYTKTKKHKYIRKERKTGKTDIPVFTFNNLYTVVDYNHDVIVTNADVFGMTVIRYRSHSMRDLSLYVYIIQPWYFNVFQQVPSGR